MRVNKFDFLKENILFRNGKSKEELLRNTTTVSTAVNRELPEKKLCFVGKLWFYQGDEQAGGRIQLFSRGLSWYVRRGCLRGGRKILHSTNYRFDCELMFWNTILINRFFIFRTVFTKCLKNVLRFACKLTRNYFKAFP